jgi:hypothetical protein
MNKIRVCSFTILAGALVLGLIGCGKGGYAPVSGVVTLDGKPARHVMVMFQPMASKDNPEPGRGSTTFTDEQGRFTLKTDDGKPGAAIGKHKVRISSVYSDKLKGYELWEPGAKEPTKSVTDPIPPEWNTDSKQEFEVPSEGTDQANFNIVTKK